MAGPRITNKRLIKGKMFHKRKLRRDTFMRLSSDIHFLLSCNEEIIDIAIFKLIR